jgi:subtilisin family serine protease
MSVVVRFVPKSRSRMVPMRAMEGLSFESAAAIVKPTQANLVRSQNALANRGVSSHSSALNRLSATLSDEEFKEMFGAAPPTLAAGEHLAAARGMALDVPDVLADVVDFAYVPQEIEYHATLAIPPLVPVYHLRVGDVALALNAPRCHGKGWTGQGIKVAMTDTGFWPHPFFVRNGYNLIPTESAGSGPADIDDNGHGTGEAANVFVMAPRCTVYGVKHGDSAAGSLEAAIALAPQIITNSWGWSIDRQSRDQFKTAPYQIAYAELVDLESIIGQAVDDGICVIFSGGNGHFAFPAGLPKVIAVGGVTVTEDGGLEASSYASSFDSKLYPGRAVPDICGVVGRADAVPMTGHIMLPVPPDSELDGDNFGSAPKGLGWGIFSGTSAAAPQVAGLVALMKQIKPSLMPDQIRSVLRATATDITKGKTSHNTAAKVGPDLATGAGLVDALKACAYL